MNKQILIVVLAVCLLSAHAFVKRETDGAKNENYLETLQKELQQISERINSQVTAALDPEQLKKGLNEAVDNLTKAVNELKSKASAAPKK